MIKTILTLPQRLWRFLDQTYAELKQVEWLSRNKTIRYTILVFTCVIAGALFILLVDRVFLAVRSLIIY